MAKIGGNLTALLQVKDEGAKNAIGEREHKWSDVTALKGWLDLVNGDSKLTNFSAKIQESTHIFICDFRSLKGLSQSWEWNTVDFINQIESDVKVDVTSQNARIMIKEKIYQIMLIDNVMEMDEQLEIYLKYVGC